MNLDTISRKISNVLDQAKRKSKPTEKALEDMEDIYDDSIESIDEMIKWLNYYLRDPENLKYEPINRSTEEIRMTSFNNRVDDAPKMIQKPYRKYRSEKPLLTGDESTVGIDRSSHRTTDWDRFCDRANKHKKFLRDLKRLFKKGKDNVKKAKKELERQKYDKKAANQRGEKSDINSNEILPDTTPEKIRNEIAKKVEDEVRENDDSNEDEEEENMQVMGTHKLVYFITNHVRKERGISYDRDLYQIYKETYPKETEIIINNLIVRTNHIENSIRKLEEHEDIPPIHRRHIEEYIIPRVSGDIPKKTPEEIRSI
jgi:hypothetical protein